MTFLPTVRGLVEDNRIRTEFINDLAACAAGRAWHALVIHYSDCADIQPSTGLRDRRKDGSALGAVGHPVGRILHIAAGEDFTFGRQECGTDAKIGVGRMSVFHHFARLMQQGLALLGRDICCGLLHVMMPR